MPMKLSSAQPPAAVEIASLLPAPGPAWSRPARSLTGFAGRQIRAAGRAAPDEAGWLVLAKDLEQLGTAVGLERVPHVVGKPERISRPTSAPQ
jgi:hypothetical protein